MKFVKLTNLLGKEVYVSELLLISHGEKNPDGTLIRHPSGMQEVCEPPSYVVKRLTEEL